MKKTHSKYLPLSRLALWFGLIFVPLTLIAGLHQYDLLYSPFDLNRLEKDEVFFFKHGSGRQLYAMKLKSLVNRPRPDIVITGNHAMKNSAGWDHFKNLDLFNFVNGNPSTFEVLDLLKALEKIGRLPKKALIHTILAHGGHVRLELRRQMMFSGGNITPPFSFSYQNLGDEFKWFFFYETYLNAIFSFSGENMIIKYPVCARAYNGANKDGTGIWLKIRMKLAEYVPPYTSLKSGLLTVPEYCQNEKNFRMLDRNGLGRNGGYIAKVKTGLIHHRVYDLPVLTKPEAEASAKNVVGGIRQLEAFARENGFRMIYLIPPRYEIPLNGPNDEVANLIFENNPDLTVIDFRRFNLDKKIYVDDTHFSEEFGEILAPCVNKILQANTPLPGRTAVKARGRTVC